MPVEATKLLPNCVRNFLIILVWTYQQQSQFGAMQKAKRGTIDSPITIVTIS